LFDLFWDIYPLKLKKIDARKVFYKKIETIDHNTIIEGVKFYIKNKPDWQKFAGPDVWLRGDRWNDEYEEIKTGRPKSL
jgi:hypothetical protein